MPSDLTHHITVQLEKLGIQLIDPGEHAKNIQAYCFRGHDDLTPSLSIRKIDGAFYCFGCGISGPNWNAFKKFLNIETLAEHQLPDPFEVFQKKLEAETAREAVSMALPWDLAQWEGPWRKISPRTMQRVSAYKWYDEFLRCYRALFPIYQYGELKGWTARRLDKDRKMPWRNAPGMPIKDILYPFDVVADQQPETIVLVEGPYDALRLVNFGIPALAIMGTNNFISGNCVTLVNAGAERIIIAMDGDTAGDKARLNIAKELRKTFEIEHFFCPKGEDPGSISKNTLRKWKNAVNNQNFTITIDLDRFSYI